MTGDNPMKKIYTLIIILLVTNIITLIGCVYCIWKISIYKDDIFGLASYAGAMQADIDYSCGRIRLYEVAVDQNKEYSGKKEDSIEIWYWPSDNLSKYSDGIFVLMYNRKMKALVKEKNEG